ncbi:MAG TPA: FMN-binding negative transcriptional regulator [Pirellulales bacterium]|jgi:transcriptional regulator|nr:FMN-binding negative transcriptional regulator [Pirellulales bacterium]
MYIPAHFRESDQIKLFGLIEQNSFGLLISQLNDELFASHLPLLVDRQSGPHGTLIGHMARANPHWQMEDPNVLVVFSGPHAYISPSWYKAENVVPTWNYVAIHVYGTFQAVEDHPETVQIVRNYVTFYEKAMPSPWTVQEGDEFIEKLTRSVVGFRVEISRIEGKWKLNQNHSRERQEKVAEQLSLRRDENSQAIANLMAHNLMNEH